MKYVELVAGLDSDKDPGKGYMYQASEKDDGAIKFFNKKDCDKVAQSLGYLDEKDFDKTTKISLSKELLKIWFVVSNDRVYTKENDEIKKFKKVKI